MLSSSLPPELLHSIVRLSIPSTFHSTTYADRQSTLRNLSLASHQFRQIAQPLLFEIVWVVGDVQLNSLLDSVESSEVRFAILEAKLQGADLRYGQKRFEPTSIERLANSAPQLQELYLSYARNDPEDNMDYAFLARFSALKSFYPSVSCFVVRTPIFLPGLRSLTLNVDSIGFRDDFLTPTALPSLRILGLAKVMDGDELLEREVLELHHLLDNLEVLVVDVQHFSIARRLLERTLVEMGDWEIEKQASVLTSIKHLRLRSMVPQYSRLSDLEGIIFLNEQIKQCQTSLETLYLCPYLHSKEDSRPEYAKAFRNLVDECSSKGIEVVYEEQWSKEGVDSYISEDFVRRMAARKKDQ